MEVLQGFMLSLKCRVEGESDPEIRWFKDGVPLDEAKNKRIEITFSVRRSQLRVNNVQPADSGNYSCIGASEKSQMSRWVYVTVIPIPDERSVADEKAHTRCPVNTCNVGQCFLINGNPVCRCPATHTGPNCSILNESSRTTPISSLSPVAVEEDFVLDKPVTYSTKKISVVDKANIPTWTSQTFNKCDLQEYRDFPECAQEKSYLFTFIATAIACSVMILIAASILGYLRRRKILRQQSAGRLDNTSSNGTVSDRGSNGEQKRATLIENGRSPYDLKGSTKKPVMINEVTNYTVSSICATANQSRSFQLPRTVSTPSTKEGGLPDNPGSYIVLTPNNAIPISPLAHVLMPEASMQSKSLSSSPDLIGSPIYKLRTSTDAVQLSELENTRCLEVLTLTDSVYCAPSNTELYKPKKPTDPPQTRAKQIYVQIPVMPTSFLLKPSSQSTAPNQQQINQSHPNDSGITDMSWDTDCFADCGRHLQAGCKILDMTTDAQYLFSPPMVIPGPSAETQLTFRPSSPV